MKFYLSGGMEYKKNLGMGWREWLTKELQKLGHGGVDPIKLEAADENGEPLQKRITGLKIEGELDEVRRLTRRFIFRKDVYGIQLSDATVVLYDASVQRGAGTISEAWESFREGRPVYLVTDFPLEEVPSWLIGETTVVFKDFESFLAYVADHNVVTKDIEAAQKARDEVFTGIY